MDLDIVKDYKVLVIGDAIFDEYFHVTTVGKSIKENAISVMFHSKERWEGGVWAAAAHTRNLCPDTTVVAGTHALLNQRFVDDFNRKLFTVHQRVELPDTAVVPQIGHYDLVIVTDFGHGFVDKQLVANLVHDAKYLVVNAQTNSTNYGFNLITKYPRANLVVLDELEARLATQERAAPLEYVIEVLWLERATWRRFDQIIITKGNEGAIGFDGKNYYHAPAVAKDVLDTMGAGDAFLCAVAPFARAGFPMSELLRIGNAAGAVKVGIVGHQKSVTREALEEVLSR